ncbi:probable nucleoporin Nup54 isoform X2 [Toxorhynchites rutilus septentrionalis]|uniref:probable nucleoporin Nup54 isoform X2 n=1 Tax=Toxorhynchites rutilus septentrionalis TaxID=329112 RepID=UPI0024794D90|nr:probable nucleoporin Nup54 isoform X2 [Toxorhynchites rutilus septentrionalis]XP_055621030.1 probable nucleoporin Nup54 isoform X2 [Toxorhynchites rutilus septentrionalis]
MSFNLGNTSSTGLGSTSTPAKPAFGNFSFGAQSSTPAFGATATSSAAPTLFGTGTATSSPFGGFGATTAAVAPASTSAFGFGTNTATSAPAFGFGTSTAPTGTSAFGGFGAAPASTTAGFGGFGGTATSTAPAFGGFGGFGATSTSTAPSLFGQTATNTSTGFGGFGSSFGGGVFGQQANTGLGFGQSLQQQQQQQQQTAALSAEEAFAQSIFNVSIFGDERDTVIAKWNYLQAMLGTGKAFYSQSNPPVDITPSNYLCRFKTMGYTKLPGKENKVGFVGLTTNKTVGQLKDQQQQFIANLNQVFGNRANIAITVDSIKTVGENKSQIVIYVEEKSMTSNETKRILATEVSNYLNQPTPKQQISTMGVETIVALVLPEEDQLKEYLENPPKGIDPRMWQQAKIDNPDPKRFIPVPMIGFQELKWRIKCQEGETGIHVSYLDKVEKEIEQLKQRHTNTTAKIMEHRRKFAELSHRILKIIVKQESTRKMGLGLSPEEEIIRSKLENMHALVSTPTQFKGKLSELLSQMRMQRNQWAHTGGINEYTLDKDSSEEMKSFLTMQQKAMAYLVETVNKDLKDLKIISDGMARLIQP